MGRWLQPKNIQPKLDWLILALFIFMPRLLHLDRFLTADEPLFLQHAREFAAGLASGDLSQTLGIGYPGVTVAWWSAPVVGSIESGELLAAYSAGRAMTALVTGLLLLFLYFLSRRLLGRWPALLGVGLLALDPYTLAYSRLLHIAAPLALFMALAGLSFLLWLRETRRRWLWLTGIFAGLALLTKSTALLLGPILVLGLLGWTVSRGHWPDRRWWASKIGGLVVLGLVATVLFFILWPAMWVDPAQALGLTFGKLFRDQEAGRGNLGMFWLGRFVEDPGPAFYPVAFFLKSTPWLLVGLLLSLYRVIRQVQAHRTEREILPVTVGLWLFALTYLVLMTIASKKSIRYMLPAFPAFYLLAGLALYQTAKALNERAGFSSRANSLTQTRLRFVAPGLLFVPIVLLTLFYHPYYFTYHNPLLLGWRWAPETLLVGWGEGLDQAARYLNAEPRSTVSAWYEWLFPVFYEGQVEPVVPQENLITADHAVLYINQVQRDIPGPNIIHYFQTRRRPEYTVRLAGIDYAWVYPGPIAGFRPDPSFQYPLGGDYGAEVRLLGYDLHPQPRSGESLLVTLYWRVLATPPAERFVFVRLVDDRGHIWARTDSPPVMGLWPASRWQPDTLIEDVQELAIPTGTPPGTYQLELGLYEPDTGQPLPARGQPVGPGGGLLLGEVTVEWQSLPADTDLPHRTDVRLAPNARLVGYGTLPEAATTGDLISLKLAWREATGFFSSGSGPNNSVLFEWRESAAAEDGPPLAEQLAELPLPIEAWGSGALLRSQHDLIVPPTLTTDRYDLWVRLHTGSDPAGDAFRLGTVGVTSPVHQFDLPAEAQPPVGEAQLAQTIRLIGYNYRNSQNGEPASRSLELRLFWQTSAPLKDRYKVFAQLLATDNSLMAQSDQFPARGQRPTTGWLPEEIIADAHTLGLPPDLPSGDYRLIAGLYDPLTGERLPLLNENGDAIFVTEVALP